MATNSNSLHVPPHSVRRSQKGHTVALKSTVRVGEKTSISQILARIADNPAVQGDTVLQPGVYTLRATVDVTEGQ